MLACNSQKDVVTSATEKQVQPLAKKVVVERDYDKKTDAYQIRSAEVVQQQLHIEVSYSGGCEGHVFELFTDGLLMKSLPPKQNFFLKHYANKDACEELFTETLVFDLTGTASQGNSLIVLLKQYDGELLMDF
jgi:hypothetical protein